MSLFSDGIKYVFGGYIKNNKIRFDSTSGGAFSAIVDAFCDSDYVIFGAASNGLEVFHTYITDKMNITLRRSRLSGVARATIPDKQSHHITNYCAMF